MVLDHRYVVLCRYHQDEESQTDESGGEIGRKEKEGMAKSELELTVDFRVLCCDGEVVCQLLSCCESDVAGHEHGGKVCRFGTRKGDQCGWGGRSSRPEDEEEEAEGKGEAKVIAQQVWFSLSYRPRLLSVPSLSSLYLQPMAGKKRRCRLSNCCSMDKTRFRREEKVAFCWNDLTNEKNAPRC